MLGDQGRTDRVRREHLRHRGAVDRLEAAFRAGPIGERQNPGRDDDKVGRIVPHQVGSLPDAVLVAQIEAERPGTFDQLFTRSAPRPYYKSALDQSRAQRPADAAARPEDGCGAKIR